MFRCYLCAFSRSSLVGTYRLFAVHVSHGATNFGVVTNNGREMFLRGRPPLTWDKKSWCCRSVRQWTLCYLTSSISNEYTGCTNKTNKNKLCAWRHNMPPPRASSQLISLHLFARWHLFRHVGYLRHQQQVDLWPFDLESGVRVTCDVGYLCANFSLPRPLCSRVRPDVRDRQTDRRQTSDKSIA